MPNLGAAWGVNGFALACSERIMVMMDCDWGMGPVGWVFMGLFWLVTLGLLVWGAATLLPGGRARLGGRSGGELLDTPEEILDRRFALGEIDVERYRQARQELAAARRGR